MFRPEGEDCRAFEKVCEVQMFMIVSHNEDAGLPYNKTCLDALKTRKRDVEFTTRKHLRRHSGAAYVCGGGVGGWGLFHGH